MPTRRITSPVPNPETQTFWAAVSEGRFTVPFCNICGEAHWYPRFVCPHCSSTNVELRNSVGTGTIYSFSIARQVPEPYVMAYVRLDEGPVMMTNIVDTVFEQIRIGQRVELVFVDSENGRPVPMFRVAAEQPQ